MPLVYLDTAATAQKPRAVIDRVRRFYVEEYAKNETPYRIGKHVTDEYERSRGVTAKFLNARSADDIVFTRNTTEAINTVANGFSRGLLSAGDEILITELEHHSNIVPWLMACERTGARLVVAPLDANGDLDLDRFAPLLSAKTKLVSLTHVSNVTGGRQPVEEVVELAHARGVPVLVDAAQSAPHIPIDVRKIGCDFLAFSGHKCYGPSGVGVLYGTADWLNKLPPSLGGEPMAAEVTFTGYTPKPPPDKFAAGVPAMASTVALGTALVYLTGLGRKAVAAHIRRLATTAADSLGAIDGVRVLGRAADRVSVVSFAVEGMEAEEVAKHLDRLTGIAVRAGHLSAQPLVRSLGLEGAVRASFAAYSTPAEARVLAEAVAEFVRKKGRTR